MQPVLEAMRDWGEAYKKRFWFEYISKNPRPQMQVGVL